MSVTSEAKVYANLIWNCYWAGNDEGVVELYREIESDYEYVGSVWAYFPAPMRRRLKEILGDFRGTLGESPADARHDG